MNLKALTSLRSCSFLCLALFAYIRRSLKMSGLTCLDGLLEEICSFSNVILTGSSSSGVIPVRLNASKDLGLLMIMERL